jgi:tetratricopeptide (TPR) repeat protein
MVTDLHELPLTAPSTAAADAFNQTLRRYLSYRADTAQPLFESLVAQPDFAMGQCLKGYLTLLGFKQANRPAAAAIARDASRLAGAATPREQMHAAALQAWADGHLERSLALWAQLLREHPTDLLAFRLSHFNLFWLGRPQAMLASIDEILPHWHEGLPGWGAMLACRCFALEECGRYSEAEPLGRAAVALDPADLWGTHAVAHVMEMQGRHQDGIDWLAGLSVHWANGNNLRHHLWWHRSLAHLAQGDTTAVLQCYDKGFRDPDSPLTCAQPDLYIDLQNAVSALYRLAHLGVPVQGRWRELADHAQARIGDCLSAFTLPHFMLALLADGREQAAAQMLDGMRAFGAGDDDGAPLVREVALPLCQSMLEAAQGQAARAVATVRPILARLPELGGSHAQQEVLLLHCWRTARAAGCDDDARAACEQSGRFFTGGWSSRAVFAVS